MVKPIAFEDTAKGGQFVYEQNGKRRAVVVKEKDDMFAWVHWTIAADMVPSDGLDAAVKYFTATLRKNGYKFVANTNNPQYIYPIAG